MKYFNKKWIALLLVCLLSALFYIALMSHIEVFRWDKIWQYKNLLFSGFINTIYISLLTFLISLLGGVLFYMAMNSRIYFFKYLSSLLRALVQGTPLIVFILVGYYIVAAFFNLQNRFAAGVVILGSFYSIVFAEIIRGGINGINQIQWLTAKSLGFRGAQIYRFIIIPQLWIRILPSLTYQTASLVKDSALLSIISVKEFYQVVTNSSSQTYATLEFYFIMALGYLLLTFPLRILSKYLEKRYHYEN